MKLDRCEEAIPKFRESQQLDPASGTLLNLAYCEVRLGRLASAWLTYRRAIPLAQERNRPVHEQIAREQAASLEPEVPRLSIVIAGDAEREITIVLDGEALARQAWFVPVPVDPGAHLVSAQLEDGKSWQASITLARGQRLNVEVPLAEGTTAKPATAPTPAVNAPDAGALRSNAMTAPGRLRPEPAPRASGQKPSARPNWALGLAGAGAAVTASGGVLFAVARVQYDSARRHCDSENRCTSRWYDEERGSIGRAKLSLGLASGGLLAATLGTVAYFSLGNRTSSSSNAVVGSFVGPKDWSAGFRGSW